MYRQLARLCLVVLFMLGYVPAGQLQAHALPQVDWPHFGNTTDQTRFSPLMQVNTTNVRQLGLAWTMPEGQNQFSWETDPIVVHGSMYLTTSTDQVVALDAATGKIRWKYTPQLNLLPLLGRGGEQPVSRGIELADGTLYLLTFDDQLIALRAATGRQLWHTTVASLQDGYTEPSPPTYWQGMLFVGSAEGDAGLRGFIAAYNATTGKQIWRWYTVPTPGHGWMPRIGHHGGGDVWMPATIDAQTGILYAATGNPSPDVDNSLRPGCNPWTDATVALNAHTGTLLWGRTQVCPDLWDYDANQTPVLLTLHYRHRTVRAVGAGNKSGAYWIFDASSGATIARSPLLSRQTLPRPVPTTHGVRVCPGKLGGLEYSPPAYSSRTGALYLPGLNLCMIYTRASQQATNAHQVGAYDFGGTAVPTKEKPSGFMAAIDPQTGGLRWQRQVPAPMIGGALATAGGLVFSGADDGRFYAFDAGSGKILWRPYLGLGFGAAPISYAVNGTQYIAIAAGGSGVTALTGGRIGGTLAVFRLDGAPIHPISTTSS